MYELVHTWLEACWYYVADWLLVLWYPNAGLTTTDLFIVDREGLGFYDHLEQGVCFGWAVLGNEFSIVVEGLDMVFFIWQE